MNALACQAGDALPRSAAAMGYTVLPRLFAPEEMGWLAGEARSIGLLYGSDADATLSPEAPQGTVFAPHRYERGFLDLAAHPRLATSIGRPLRLHQTRLWPGGRRAVPPGLWSDAPVWRRLDGIDATGAVTAVVFLEDAADGAGLFVSPAGSLSRGEADAFGIPRSSALLSLLAGSVVLLDSTLSYAPADGAGSYAPSLFFSALISVDAVRSSGRRRAPFVEEPPLTAPRADNCLWPTPIL